MSDESRWDFGWHGEKFILTEERGDQVVQQIVIPNAIALEMAATIVSLVLHLPLVGIPARIPHLCEAQETP
jgi:hypothetical protein